MHGLRPIACIQKRSKAARLIALKSSTASTAIWLKARWSTSLNAPAVSPVLAGLFAACLVAGHAYARQEGPHDHSQHQVQRDHSRQSTERDRAIQQSRREATVDEAQRDREQQAARRERQLQEAKRDRQQQVALHERRQDRQEEQRSHRLDWRDEQQAETMEQASPAPATLAAAQSTANEVVGRRSAQPAIQIQAPRTHFFDVTSFHAQADLDAIRGDRLMRTGDVQAARRLYERSAAAGSALGAVGLGRTYDPSVVPATASRAVKTDALVAAIWYKRAELMGRPQPASPMQDVNLIPSN